MIIRDFLPNPVFSEFIQCYRIVHFDFMGVEVVPFKAYTPKPEVCLHFFLHDQEEVEMMNSQKTSYNFPVVLTGQQTSLMKRYVGRDFLNFQIVFQPTSMFRFTGIPSFEFTDHYLDAELILPKDDIRTIYGLLQDAKSYSQMLLIVDKFIADLIINSRKAAQRLDFVSQLMVQRWAKISLDNLAKDSCLCSKQFERKFYERVGIHPTMYAKIIRFNRTFNFKNAFPKKDWLEIAIFCGYYDHQHLDKNYKEFTGYTPNKLHDLENISPERRLGLTNELYKSRCHLLSQVF